MLAPSSNSSLAPEIVDKKIVSCNRIWNERIKCFDFIDKTNKVAFRTCPHLEKDKIVFQMGTADPDIAVLAAKKVVQDVAAIDVNSGCPVCIDTFLFTLLIMAFDTNCFYFRCPFQHASTLCS